MTDRPPLTPSDFFSNTAAREAGFTDEFWYAVYVLFEEAIASDPSNSFDKVDIERTFRMPFRTGHVDVLVRTSPDAREYPSVRFTVFPAGDEPEARQVLRWYKSIETRPVLGEGAYLNFGFPW